MIADIHAPLGSFLPCLLWLVMPGWIVILVHKMIMGDIDTGTGFIAMFVGIYLGFLAWSPPAPWVEPAAILSVFAIMVGLPVSQKLMEKHGDKLMEIEQMEGIYESLRRNPQNWVAVFRLGKMAYEKGLTHYGIALAAQALPHLPVFAYREEHRMVAQWQAVSATRPNKVVHCLECSRPCHVGEIYCTNCWAPFLMHHMRGGTGTPASIIRRVVTVWSALMVTIFAVPSLSKFGPGIVLPVTIVILGLCLWAVVGAFTETVKNS